MPTFIKAGFWEQLCKPCKGYKGWLNLDEFVAARAGGDGYTYKEIDISSNELINPSLLPNGSKGIIVLPELPNEGEYYEWKMNVEFTPGSTAYDGGPLASNIISVTGSWAVYPSLSIGDLIFNQLTVWQLNSGTSAQFTQSILGEPANPSGFPNYLCMLWNDGTFLIGDGTMKVKVWYKVVNFG